MDFRTPSQIVLGLLLAAMALSLLGLAADNISYVGHQQSPLEIHYMRMNETAKAPFSYWVKIDYLPSKFSLGTMHAMLAAGVICFVVGTGIAVGSWMLRKEKALRTGFSLKMDQRTPPFLPVALILTSITFVVSLCIAIYAWYPVMRYPIYFKNSLPYPSKSPGALPAQYKSPFPYTPEVWNCAISPYVVDPVRSQRLQGLCNEASAAKNLMIPVVLLSAALLACLVWTWQTARVAAASDERTVKEIEVESVHSKE